MKIEIKQREIRAFTLIEVVVASVVAAIMVTGCVTGYIMSTRRAEWSAYSLAATAQAMMRLEQCRAAKWDPMAYPPVDELVSSNFPVETNVLDIPISGTNIVYATNFTTITLLSSSPPLKMIRVDCHWPFTHARHFTSSVVTYRGPDQ